MYNPPKKASQLNAMDPPFPVDMTIVNRALLLKNHRDRPKNQPIKKSQCRIG